MEDHDLCHFAVEITLQFKNGFYGLIDRGFNISDFELPRNERPLELIPANLPLEAQQTEFIVNLLQTELWNTGINPDFLILLKDILS
jgi:hypothetical protein